jgi:hypothetical protein
MILSLFGPASQHSAPHQRSLPVEPKCKCGAALVWQMVSDMLSCSVCPSRRWWNFWHHFAPFYSPEDL